MSQHPTKFQRANVSAAFDDQGGADEALYDLRAAGFPDARIGYFTPAPGGVMVDALAARHRFGAAVLGGFVGGAIGVGIVYLLHRLGAAGPDPMGLGITLGLAGAFFGGLGLGVRGVWVERDDAAIPSDAPIVMTVEAGGNSGWVKELLHRRRGHDLHPAAGSHAA